MSTTTTVVHHQGPGEILTPAQRAAIDHAVAGKADAHIALTPEQVKAIVALSGHAE